MVLGTITAKSPKTAKVNVSLCLQSILRCSVHLKFWRIKKNVGAVPILKVVVEFWNVAKIWNGIVHVTAFEKVDDC